MAWFFEYLSLGKWQPAKVPDHPETVSRGGRVSAVGDFVIARGGTVQLYDPEKAAAIRAASDEVPRPTSALETYILDMPEPTDPNDMHFRGRDDNPSRLERVVARAIATARAETWEAADLAWEAYGDDQDHWRAPAPLFGNIRVDNYGFGFEVNWSVPGHTETLVKGMWETADLAKAAAQEHVNAALRAKAKEERG
jgi:hypothetical protein